MFEEENFPERPIENKIPTVTSNLTEPKNKPALQEEGLIFDKKEGLVNSIKFVFQQVFKLFYKPKETFENIRKKEGIGWPLLVLFSLYLLYALLGGILFYFFSKSSLSTIPFISSPSSSLNISNTFIFIVIFTLYFFMVIFYSVAFWTNAFLWGNFFNQMYRGKGKWYQYAVVILYLQISLVIVTLPLFILSILIGRLFSSLNAFFIVFLIGQLILLVWWIVWQVLIAKIYYMLSLIKAFLAVLTPIILLIIITTSLFLYMRSYTKTLLSKNEERNISDLSKLNLNVNFNSNVNFNTNLTVIPYYQLSSEFRSENTKALLREMQEIPLGGDLDDRKRQTDLINLKYNLKAYYQFYQQYPKTSEKEKLTGTDALNTTLSEFFGYKFMIKDPVSSQYYYSYESDGPSFTLTGYLASKSQIYTITDKD